MRLIQVKSGEPTGGVTSASPALLLLLLLFLLLLEEGAFGDLLLDNKHTFREGEHTGYVTLRAREYNGRRRAALGASQFAEVFLRGCIMPRPRARSPRRDPSPVTHSVPEK